MAGGDEEMEGRDRNKKNPRKAGQQGMGMPGGMMMPGGTGMPGGMMMPQRGRGRGRSFRDK